MIGFMWLNSFYSYNSALAQDKPIKSVVKSSLGFIADPITQDIQKKASLFLPAGTRLLIYDRSDENGRRLILTEFGVWGYVHPDNLYSDDVIDKFIKGSYAVITRDVSIDLDGGLSATLTPSEHYKIVDIENGNITIELDNNRFPFFKDEWTLGSSDTKEQNKEG